MDTRRQYTSRWRRVNFSLNAIIKHIPSRYTPPLPFLYYNGNIKFQSIVYGTVGKYALYQLY